MTRLDLDAIEERASDARSGLFDRSTESGAWVLDLAEDVQALVQRVRELEADNDKSRHAIQEVMANGLSWSLVDFQKRVTELENALEPFATHYERMVAIDATINDDERNAARVLGGRS